MRGGRAAVSATVALILLLTACGSRDQFEPREFGEIEQALTAEGLEICDATVTDGHANQAVAGREYRVALDCSSDDDATVVVDEFTDVDHRDAAARNFEGQVRPRAYGAVWTFGPFVIGVSGPRGNEVEDKVTAAVDKVGAE